MRGPHQIASGEQLFFRQQIDQRTGVFVTVVVVRMTVLVMMRGERLVFGVKGVMSGFTPHKHAQPRKQHRKKSGEQHPVSTDFPVLSGWGRHEAGFNWSRSANSIQ